MSGTTDDMPADARAGQVMMRDLFQRCMWIGLAASTFAVLVPIRFQSINLFPLDFYPEILLLPGINPIYRPYIAISNSISLYFIAIYLIRVRSSYRLYIYRRIDFAKKLWLAVMVSYAARLFFLNAFESQITAGRYDPSVSKMAPVIVPLAFPLINLMILAFGTMTITAFFDTSKEDDVDWH